MAIILDVLIFLAPHILSILSDLVAKWNHDVPSELANEYWKDFDLVKTKFSTLPMSNDFKSVINELEKVMPDSSSFVILMEKFSIEWNKLCQIEVDKCVTGISNDLSYSIETINNDMTKVMSGFNSAWRAHKIMPRFMDPIDNGIMLINDALLCIARMMPNRLIAGSDILSTQGLVPFWINYEKGINLSVPHSFFEMYNVEYGFAYKSHSKSVSLNYGKWFCTPRIDFVTSKYFKDVFESEMKEVTMYSLTTLTNKYLCCATKFDVNMVPSQIFQKILGSSITSLELVLSKLQVWLLKSYLRKNQSVSQEVAIDKVTSGPFYYVDKISDFKQPFRLFKTCNKNEVNKNRLEQDFVKLQTLITLYKSEISRKNEMF